MSAQRLRSAGHAQRLPAAGAGRKNEVASIRKTTTVPIALDAAMREGLATRADTVVLVAFGGGLAWRSDFFQ
jgi:3-Oxoacyl-[acyl-carrier-protein (ACP)] synthase III C terminal